MWLLARKLLANQSDAEDAVQEAFIEIWRAAPKFDPAVASARAFVAMIARRRIIDRGRIEQRRVRGVVSAEVLPIAAAAPSGAPLIDDQARKLMGAIEQLRPEQQQAIRLSIGQGWSHQEIADRLGMPVGTVKTHLRRGLLRLRELIEGAPTREPEGAPA